MGKRPVWLFAAIAVALSAQSASAQSAAPGFTNDEIAIYRDFLLHYPAQLSNMIGMQDTTVAFATPAGDRTAPVPPNLQAPAYSGRKLPPEITALTGEKEVTARIAAKGKLVDPSRRGPDQGPDGYVRTHLTLSEIAFDPKREEAAFVFSASCRCLGGQGGMVLYEKKHGRWKMRTIANAWEG